MAKAMFNYVIDALMGISFLFTGLTGLIIKTKSKKMQEVKKRTILSSI